MQPHPSGPRKPQGVVPGKLNLPSRWPGEGLGGVVALDGLDDAGKGRRRGRGGCSGGRVAAGVQVVHGWRMLLQDQRHGEWTTQPSLPAHPLPTWKGGGQPGALALVGVMLEGRTAQRNLHSTPDPWRAPLIFLISAQASFPPQKSSHSPWWEARLPHPRLSSQGPENFSLGHLNYGLPAAGVVF